MGCSTQGRHWPDRALQHIINWSLGSTHFLSGKRSTNRCNEVLISFAHFIQQALPRVIVKRLGLEMGLGMGLGIGIGMGMGMGMGIGMGNEKWEWKGTPSPRR